MTSTTNTVRRLTSIEESNAATGPLQLQTTSSSAVSTPATEHKRKSGLLLAAKHEKLALHAFETHAKEIRAQLGDQLKCLEQRTETQNAVLSELDDFFRRRADIEHEQARQLEKLAKSTVQRHRQEKSKRDAWSQHGVHHVWQQLVEDAQAEAAARRKLATFYEKQVPAAVHARQEHVAAVAKKCREIGVLAHSELNRVLGELYAAMKVYQVSFSEQASVERKYRAADEARQRFEREQPKAYGGRKHRGLCKAASKRQGKWEAARLKGSKARNEYLLALQAANRALHRFFADDLDYLIDAVDLGADAWLRALLDKCVQQRKTLCEREMDALADLAGLRMALDSKADKQRFFAAHHALFSLPRDFDFRPQMGDRVGAMATDSVLADELSQRVRQIERRLEELRQESDDVWKTLESAERRVVALHLMQDESGEKEELSAKTRNEQLLTTHHFYLKKFEFWLLNGNLAERLEARASAIREALSGVGAAQNAVGCTPSSSSASTTTGDQAALPNGQNGGGGGGGELVPRLRRKRIGTADSSVASNPPTRPRLFGGSLEEYVEATAEPIPLLVESAIRVLSRYALHHQGLFRVSGSACEIARYKEAFERGEDAFSSMRDASEANSVAGVLKAYLRELREPLFPTYLFEQFTECARFANDTNDSSMFVDRMRALLSRLPCANVVLLRYLFAFLAHLCEHSEHNCMEPYSVAVCFGPALLPIPEGRDQVFYHNHVNALVKGLVQHQEAVFAGDSLPGPRYERHSPVHHHPPLHQAAHQQRARDDDERTSCDDLTLDETAGDLEEEERRRQRMKALAQLAAAAGSRQSGTTEEEEQHHFNELRKTVAARQYQQQRTLDHPVDASLCTSGLSGSTLSTGTSKLSSCNGKQRQQQLAIAALLSRPPRDEVYRRDDDEELESGADEEMMQHYGRNEKGLEEGDLDEGDGMPKQYSCDDTLHFFDLSAPTDTSLFFKKERLNMDNNFLVQHDDYDEPPPSMPSIHGENDDVVEEEEIQMMPPSPKGSSDAENNRPAGNHNGNSKGDETTEGSTKTGPIVPPKPKKPDSRASSATNDNSPPPPPPPISAVWQQRGLNGSNGNNNHHVFSSLRDQLQLASQGQNNGSLHHSTDRVWTAPTPKKALQHLTPEPRRASVAPVGSRMFAAEDHHGFPSLRPTATEDPAVALEQLAALSLLDSATRQQQQHHVVPASDH